MHDSLGDLRPHLTFDTLGVSLFGLLDSGATRTMLGGSGWNKLSKLGLQMMDVGKERVQLADGVPILVRGKVYLPLKLNGKIRVFEVLIVPDLKNEIILGLDFWRRMENPKLG